jgi:hypothetical protein
MMDKKSSLIEDLKIHLKSKKICELRMSTTPYKTRPSKLWDNFEYMDLMLLLKNKYLPGGVWTKDMD